MLAAISIPGSWMWSQWQPDRGMPFNSYFFETTDGGVIVDPLPLDDAGIECLRSRGGVRTIVITNPEHVRASAALREIFDAEIVDNPNDGDEVFPGAFALRIEHGKSPEFALHLRAAKAAVIGDAIIGAPAGALSLLPDAKLADPRGLALQLRRLWALELDALLLGDGYPIFAHADAAIGTLLESRIGADLYRINLDELAFERYKGDSKYGVDDAEVGLLIGARKLGYRIAEIAPGRVFCPMHWHVEEEEVFYVLSGRPSIRTHRGTIACRPGDFIAFPTGERGTHQLLNDSGDICRVLLVGANAWHESCFYPDSRKVLVDVRGSEGLMVRSEPQLDYFEGE